MGHRHTVLTGFAFQLLCQILFEALAETTGGCPFRRAIKEKAEATWWHALPQGSRRRGSWGNLVKRSVECHKNLDPQNEWFAFGVRLNPPPTWVPSKNEPRLSDQRALH